MNFNTGTNKPKRETKSSHGLLPSRLPFFPIKIDFPLDQRQYLSIKIIRILKNIFAF